MLGRIQGIGATPILMTPTMFDSERTGLVPTTNATRTPRPSTTRPWPTTVRGCERSRRERTRVRRYVEPAEQSDAGAAEDRTRLYSDPRRRASGCSRSAGDGCRDYHDMNLPKQVSGITINLNAKNDKQRAKAVGGTWKG